MLSRGQAVMTVPAERVLSAPVQVSTVRRWYVLSMMCLVYTLSIADRFVISTVLEPIRLELGLSDSGIAFLTGVALALFYVAFGFPLAWLADRRSRRKLIALSLMAWSLMTVCCGLSRNYVQLLLARIGVGVGEAGGTPAANSILSDYFPVLRRPMALTVFSLGAPIGAWIAADVCGSIADQSGWRAAFLALGAPGALLSVLVFLTVREPPRGGLDAQAPPPAANLATTWRFLVRQRSAMHILAGGALTALWGWGLMWWTPAFLMRSYALTAGQAGSLLAPIHLVGGVGATLATAWVLGRPWMQDPRRIVWLLGAGVGVATLVSGVIYSTHSLILAKRLMWIFVPAIYFYIGPGFGLMVNLAEPRMRAMFCAALLFVANVCNLVVAPQVIGLLSDWFAGTHGADAASLRAALLCLVPTGLWAAWHYFQSARTVFIDQERATGLAPAHEAD